MLGQRLLASRVARTLAVALVLGIILGLGLWKFGPSGRRFPHLERSFKLTKQSSYHTVAFGADGRLAVSGGGGDKTISVWDTARSELVFTLPGRLEQVSHLAMSADGHYLAAGSASEQAWELWDLGTRRLVTSGRVDDRIHADHTFFGPFSPNGRYLAVQQAGGREEAGQRTAGKIRLIEVANPTGPGLVYSMDCNVLAFSPDSQTFALPGVQRKGLVLYETATGKEKASTSLGTHVPALAFSPDGKVLAVSMASLQLFDVDPLRMRTSWQGPKGVSAVVFAPDGRALATAGNHEGQAKLWDPVTGKELATVPGAYIRPARALAFSRDSTTLFVAGIHAAGDDYTVSVWRLRE
jgi:WD40 repeat protein